MRNGTIRTDASPPNRAWIVALGVILLLAYTLRLMLLPLVAAAAVAYVTRPAVEWLRRRFRLPRIAAVLVVYVIVLATVAGFGWWVVSSISGTVVRASHELPRVLDHLVEDALGPEIHFLGETIRADDVSRRIRDIVVAWLSEPGTAAVMGGFAVAAPAAAVLAFVALFYFIHSGSRLADGALWLVPPRYRNHIRDLARRVDPVLRHYIRGVLLVVLYTSVAAYIGLGLIFHLPFAPILSVVVGVLELIPVLGPAASMTLIGFSALVQGGGASSFFWALVFAVALRVSIDEIVGPVLLGRAVTLHPMVVIFAFLVGATLFGVLGVLLAVPVAAAAKIVLGTWYDSGEVAAGPDAPEDAGPKPVGRGE